MSPQPPLENSTFTTATSLKALSPNTYTTSLLSDWSIGTVPHGGIIASLFLSVAKKHFTTTLKSQNQPHTISLHLEFLRRTECGPALFTVTHSKLGRQTSVIHISLSQEGSNGARREEAVGYITNSNLLAEKGISLDTNYALHPPAPPVDLSLLRDNKDPNWKRLDNLPFPKFRKASQKVVMHFPRNGQVSRSIADEYLCFRNGERFTQESLGYVCDTFPMIVEQWRDENPYDVSDGAAGTKDDGGGVEIGGVKISAAMWYPTLSLNLDVKKLLPEEGVEWLHLRVMSKVIRNGRMDLDIEIRDADGDVVALSHHATLALAAERNTSKRSHDKSKI